MCSSLLYFYVPTITISKSRQALLLKGKFVSLFQAARVHGLVSFYQNVFDV